MSNPIFPAIYLHSRHLYRTLIPPSQARFLFPSINITNELPDIDPRVGKYDVEKHPDLDPSIFIVVEQDTNEAIFVPSGWYHLVENMDTLEDSTIASKHKLTVSINHNWFNVFSMYEVFQFLLRDLNAVRNEISHLRAGENEQSDQNGEICKMREKEWYIHCEILLKANTSLGLLDFIGIISARALMYMMYYRNECDVSIVDLEKQQYLQWRHYLCPWYDINCINSLDTQDVRCLELLASTEIREELMDIEGGDTNWLSHFMPASSSSMNVSRRIHDNIEYPVKALKFSVLVIRNLLNIISEEFPELVAHVDANKHSTDSYRHDNCVTVGANTSHPGYEEAVSSMNNCINLLFSTL